MTCRALVSGPVTGAPSSCNTALPLASDCGTPALRKYLLTMMSVASWLHAAGISASFISKTTLPSGLLMRLVRLAYSTVSKTFWPDWRDLVKRRLIFMTALPAWRAKWGLQQVLSVTLNRWSVSLLLLSCGRGLAANINQGVGRVVGKGNGEVVTPARRSTSPRSRRSCSVSGRSCVTVTSLRTPPGGRTYSS